MRLSPDWFIRDFAVGRFDCLRLVSAMGKPTMPNAMPNDQSPHPSPQSPMPSAQGQCPMPSAQHPISNPQAPIPFPRKNGTEEKYKQIHALFFPVWGNTQSWKMIRHALQQLWKSQRRKAGNRCSDVGAAVSGVPPALDMHALLGQEAEAQAEADNCSHTGPEKTNKCPLLFPLFVCRVDSYFVFVSLFHFGSGAPFPNRTHRNTKQISQINVS